MILTDEQIAILREEIALDNNHECKDVGDWAALAGKRYAINKLLIGHIASIAKDTSKAPGDTGK